MVAPALKIEHTSLGNEKAVSLTNSPSLKDALIFIDAPDIDFGYDTYEEVEDEFGVWYEPFITTDTSSWRKVGEHTEMPPTYRKYAELPEPILNAAISATSGVEYHKIAGDLDSWVGLYTWYFVTYLQKTNMSVEDINQLIPVSATSTQFRRIESLMDQSPQGQARIFNQLTEQIQRSNTKQALFQVQNSLAKQTQDKDDKKIRVTIIPPIKLPVMEEDGKLRIIKKSERHSISYAYLTEVNNMDQPITPSVISEEKFTLKRPLFAILEKAYRVDHPQDQAHYENLYKNAIVSGNTPKGLKSAWLTITTRSKVTPKTLRMAAQKKVMMLLNQYEISTQLIEFKKGETFSFGNAIIVSEEEISIGGTLPEHLLKLKGSPNDFNLVLSEEADLEYTSDALSFAGEITQQSSDVTNAERIRNIEAIAKQSGIKIDRSDLLLIFAFTKSHFAGSEDMRRDIISNLRNLGLSKEQAQAFTSRIDNLINLHHEDLIRIAEDLRDLFEIEEENRLAYLIQKHNKSRRKSIIIVSSDELNIFKKPIDRNRSKKLLANLSRVGRELNPVTGKGDNLSLIGFSAVLSSFQLGMDINPESVTSRLGLNTQENRIKEQERAVLVQNHPEIRDGLRAAERFRRNRLIVAITTIPFSNLFVDARHIPQFKKAINTILGFIVGTGGDLTPDVHGIESIIGSFGIDILTATIAPGHISDTAVQAYRDRERVRKLSTILINAYSDPLDGLRYAPNVRAAVERMIIKRKKK